MKFQLFNYNKQTKRMHGKDNRQLVHGAANGAGVSSEHSSGAEQPPQQNWWEFCPVCGSKLFNRKCRFICSDSQCHYFMSCSEFDL